MLNVQKFKCTSKVFSLIIIVYFISLPDNPEWLSTCSATLNSKLRTLPVSWIDYFCLPQFSLLHLGLLLLCSNWIIIISSSCNIFFVYFSLVFIDLFCTWNIKKVLIWVALLLKEINQQHLYSSLLHHFVSRLIRMKNKVEKQHFTLFTWVYVLDYFLSHWLLAQEICEWHSIKMPADTITKHLDLYISNILHFHSLA